NYFPSLAIGKVVGTFDAEQDLINEGAKDLFSSINEVDAMDEATLAARNAKSKKNRRNVKGYYYEFDATKLAAKHSKAVLMDLYNSTEFKKLNRLMKDAEFARTMSPKLVKSLTKSLKHISGAQAKYDNNEGALGKLGKSFWKFRDNVYTAAIATTGQFALQSVSGIANAAV